jgi:hypothetical protein
MAAILACRDATARPVTKKGLIRIAFSVILCLHYAQAESGRVSFRFPIAASTQPAAGLAASRSP